MSVVIPAPLREEVTVRKLVQQGETSYVIKEPDKQEYYRFSEPQYQLIALFDGTKDIPHVVSSFNQNSQLYEFDEEAGMSLYNRCKDYQLLVRGRAQENVALLERIREERKKKLLQAQGSLLLMRFKLVDPNRFFDQIIDSIRFMWHPKAIQMQIAFMALAFMLVVFQGDRFVQDFSRVYLQTQASGILWIWVIALGAIALHECGHGLTCKYYGGDVHEMGFLLLAFQPCLYCNVNDAWLFEKKSQKIQVALAGVWVEMLLAAVSAIVWLLVDVNNPIGYVAFVLMTIGTASSLFVNLNPLLKFDGYYILTDLVEIQNLRQNAIAWFSWNLKTKLLGMDEEPPLQPSEREKRIYMIYGGLVVIYMTLMLSFIAYIGYQFVSAQAGFLANIAFIYLVFFLVRKITGTWGATMVNWVQKNFWSTQRRKHVTLVGLLAFLGLLIFWEPSIRIDAQGQVEARKLVVYAPQDGYVTKVNYDENRQLQVDGIRPLIELASPALSLEVSQIQSKYQVIERRRAQAIQAQELGQVSQLSLEEELAVRQRSSLDNKLKSLAIAAPDGQWEVEGLPPHMMEGRFFAKSAEILTLNDKQTRFVDVIMDQRDVTMTAVDDSARVLISGVADRSYPAQVRSIAPVATAAGPEQRFLVRLEILETGDLSYLVVGLPAQALILGEELPLWRHFVHMSRKFLRADLWL